MHLSYFLNGLMNDIKRQLICIEVFVKFLNSELYGKDLVEILHVLRRGHWTTSKLQSSVRRIWLGHCMCRSQHWTNFGVVLNQCVWHVCVCVTTSTGNKSVALHNRLWIKIFLTTTFSYEEHARTPCMHARTHTEIKMHQAIQQWSKLIRYHCNFEFPKILSSSL